MRTSVATNPSQAARERIRLLIAEPTRIGCELLQAALRRDRNIEVVSVATTAAEVFAVAAAANPHIVILSPDLEDGAEAGLHVLRRITGLPQPIRVIVTLEGGGQTEVVSYFRAGAKGVFRRSESLSKLIRCVHAVYGGEIWARSSDLNLLMEAFASSSNRTFQCVNANGDALLTAREEQVVGLVAEGFTNAEIAHQLGLSEHTVKNYLFKIYDKLGISTRVELILYVISHSKAA